jgi:hypothetical protein
MTAVEIKLYDFFRQDLKLDDARAKVFTEVLYESIENQNKNITTEFKSVFKEDLLKLEIKIEQNNTKIEQSKSEMLRWFIGLFLVLAMMIIGLYIKK